MSTSNKYSKSAIVQIYQHIERTNLKHKKMKFNAVLCFSFAVGVFAKPQRDIQTRSEIEDLVKTIFEDLKALGTCDGCQVSP